MSIQIPNLHTSNRTEAKVTALVQIVRRQDSTHAGTFTVKGTFKFNPLVDDYPSCSLSITVDLTDSVKGTFISRDVQQLDTTGKVTPTLFATGKCNFDGENARDVRGCRYWLLMADNKREEERETADVISFLIYDRNGKRVAYGTGPVAKGDVSIRATPE